MVVTYLELLFFRNYQSFSSQFSPGINFIYGRNGQGKTNLIESLYVLTHLKSFRTSHISELENFEKDASFIKANLLKQSVYHEVKINLEKNQKKVHLDGKKIGYTSDYIKNFFSILFSPDQLVFFKEYPLERRNFFDRVLLLGEPGYFNLIKDFNKIKKQKGILLRQKLSKNIAVWNKLLASLVPKITQSREDLVDRINVILGELFRSLTGRKEKLTLHYQSDLEKKTDLNESSIFEFLQEKLDSEMEKGFLNYGPHKDRFWMSLNEKKDKLSFSQGEHRITFLTLQFAVNIFVKETLGFNPIILLDDVFSELDSAVLENTMKYINQIQNQVFITSTEIPSMLSSNDNTILIEKGQRKGI